MRKPVQLEVSLLGPPRKSGPRVAVVFPNDYEIGMANLGVQTVFRTLYERGAVQVERVFLSDDPRSVESNTRLSDFELILFSISFELDVLNVVHVLSAS